MERAQGIEKSGDGRETEAASSPVLTRYSYEKFLKDFSVRIKQLRKERGWTLRDMVVRHDFHLTHWQAFESGKRGFSLPSLLRIAEVFDLRLCDLLADAGELNEELLKTPVLENSDRAGSAG